MTVALWIIAICEVIRAAQNMVQIATIRHDKNNRDNVYAEFIKSIKQPDRDFVRDMLEEFERLEGKTGDSATKADGWINGKGADGCASHTTENQDRP